MHSGHGRRPDPADLLRQWFCRETGKSPHDQMTGYPHLPDRSSGLGKGRLWGNCCRFAVAGAQAAVRRKGSFREGRGHCSGDLYIQVDVPASGRVWRR